MKSVLLGNGVNINFAGKAYTNKFILDRIIFNARANKYDKLFGGKVSGEEIVTVFKGFIEIANQIINGDFDYLENCDEEIAIKSFKLNYEDTIQKYQDIMLEDWFLLIRLFFLTNIDIEEQWQAAKQGFEQLILDAIYNDGEITTIYKSMNKKVRRYFNEFDYVFTLNYDCNIEELTGRNVMHLHGDFSVLADSENPETINGFLRCSSGKTVVIDEFKHCYCNALLNYSGELKYRRAESIIKADSMVQNWLELFKSNPDEYDRQISLLKEKSEETFILIDTYIKNPTLRIGTDYQFETLKNISGELHIIGLSPNNDEHIFRCIDESKIDKVFFYSRSGKVKELPIKKPYEIKLVSELWESLDAKPKVYNCSYPIPNNSEIDKYIECFNAMSFDKITKKQIIDEVNSIPIFEMNRLCDIIKSKMKEFENSDCVEELEYQFREISRIGLREGIYPSALFMLFVMNNKE